MKHAIFIIKGLEKNVIPTLHQDAFKKAGITWEFWGSKYLSRDSSTVKTPPPNYGDVKVNAVTKDKLSAVLPQLHDTYFIIDYSFESKNTYFLKQLKRYNIPYIVIINRTSELHTKLFHKLRKGTKNSFWRLLNNMFLSNIRRFWLNYISLLPSPVLAIVGTKKDLVAYNYPIPPEGLKYFHNENYEKLLIAPPTVSNDGILLFVDQYLPWHNDTQAFVNWNMNAELYYSKIAKFLTILGNKLNLKPIIAAHPKSKENLIEPLIGNIPLVYASTPSLIGKASLIVQHTSLTIEQSVLLKKPVLLASCKEVNNSPLVQTLEVLKKTFDANDINIDNYLHEDYDIEEIKSKVIYSGEHHSYFMNNNIKHQNSTNGSYWGYIAQTIQKH